MDELEAIIANTYGAGVPRYFYLLWIWQGAVCIDSEVHPETGLDFTSSEVLGRRQKEAEAC